MHERRHRKLTRPMPESDLIHLSHAGAAHTLDVTEDATEEEQRVAAHLKRLARAASLIESRESVSTALPCWRTKGRGTCRGQLLLRVVRERTSKSSVDYACPLCGLSGMLLGWDGGGLDLTQLAPRAPREVTVRLPRKVYLTLLEEPLLAFSDERILLSAAPSAGQVALEATRSELEDLHGVVCAAANHAPSRARQRDLDAASEALRQAIEGRPPKRKVSKVIARVTEGLDLTDDEVATLERFLDSPIGCLGQHLFGRAAFDAHVRSLAENFCAQRAWADAFAADDAAALEAALVTVLGRRQFDAARIHPEPAVTCLDRLMSELAEHLPHTRHPDAVASLILRGAEERLAQIVGGPRRVQREAQSAVLDLWTLTPHPALRPLEMTLLRSAKRKADRVALAKDIRTRRANFEDPHDLLESLLERLEAASNPS